MGSFSMQCSLSGLGISGGTKVRCLLVTESPYDGDDPRKAWIVRTPPIRAVNNDYGSICDVHPDDARVAELWLRGLREDAVEKGLGDNCCHDVPVFRDMTFEQLLVAIQERRLEVIRDARNFWSHRKRGVGDTGESWTPPLLRRVAELLEGALPGHVSREAEDDKYVVDEPVPSMARVRFGRFGKRDSPAALAKAQAAIEEAAPDLTCAITAGTGAYADDADLLVFPRPATGDKHVFGPRWAQAKGASADDDKTLRVGLVMIREDVWQAVLRFPHEMYVSDQYPKDLKFAHVRQKVEYGTRVWYGIEAFKFAMRAAWESIRKDLLREPGDEAPLDEEGIDQESQKKLDELIEGYRKAEADKVAAMTPEERAAYDAERAAQVARWEAEKQRKKDHPFFGDFRITSMHHDHVTDLPGAWSLVDSVPGVLGRGDHMSMLLADKVEAWDGLLDGLAELAAVESVARGVGVVLRPSESTGPQYPEWGESIRFARAVLDVATAAGVDDDDDLQMSAPATLEEATPAPPAKKSRRPAKKKPLKKPAAKKPVARKAKRR